MPMYDFLCPDDGEFEKLCLATVENPHAGTETTHAPCPKCGKDCPRVQLMGDNVQFDAQLNKGRKNRYHIRHHFNYQVD